MHQAVGGRAMLSEWMMMWQPSGEDVQTCKEMTQVCMVYSVYLCISVAR